MKNCGQRIIDESGRVTLPSELRESLGLEANTEVNLYSSGSVIILQKAEKVIIPAQAYNSNDIMFSNFGPFPFGHSNARFPSPSVRPYLL